MSGTSTPTTSVTTTNGGPAATTTTGSQSNDDDDDGHKVVPYTGAGSIVHAGAGGALAILLVAVAM